MAGSVTINDNIAVALADAASALNLTPNTLITVAGVHLCDSIQDVTSTGGALSVSPCASVSLLMVSVLSGTANATVSFYYDAGFADQIVNAAPQQTTPLRLMNPPTIYAKASAGTVQVRVFAIEQ